MSLRVLVVQAETAHAQPLIRFFQTRGDQVWEAWDLGQADSLAAQVKPDLLVLDLHFSGDAWLKFLRQQKRRSPGIKVILTSRTPDLQRELQAQALGLNVFLRHPFEPAWLQAALDRLNEKQPAPVSRSPERRGLPLWLKISLPYALLSLSVVPVMIVAMGAVVAFIVFSVLMPILQINNLAGG
jgi:CheY-like chemotaxis protein